MNKLARFASLGLVLALLCVVIGGVTAQDDMKTVIWRSDPTLSLDPSLSTTPGDDQVIESIGVGLLRVNQVTFEIEPGMATTWEVSDDFTTYTFHLMEGVPWVFYNQDTGEVEQVTDENGAVRLVTAHDYAFGIRRTLDPRTAAENASLLAPWIAGAEELIASADASDEEIDALVAALGVEVLDDQTIRLTSPQGSPLAIWSYTLSLTMAQPAWLVEEIGEDLWATYDYIQGFGPFVLKEFQIDDHYTLMRNPFWPGTESVPASKIDEIRVVHPNFETWVAAFEAGEIDGFQDAAPPQDVKRALADPVLKDQIVVRPSKFMQQLGFNVLKAPFDDARVRRAFSMAIDRQGLVDNVLAGGGIPAATFTIPTIAGAPSPDLYPQIGVHDDPEAARALLQEYLDEKGITTADLNITVMHNTSEYHALIYQALQQMWADNLGVNVQLANQEWAVYNDTLRVDAPQAYRYFGTWDYPDADSMLYGWFHSGSPLNFTNWSNPAFDQLIEQARFETDMDARRELYAQAEQILVYEDAVIAPLFYNTLYSFTKPWLQRDVTGGLLQRFETWDVVK